MPTGRISPASSTTTNRRHPGTMRIARSTPRSGPEERRRRGCRNRTRENARDAEARASPPLAIQRRRRSRSPSARQIDVLVCAARLHRAVPRRSGSMPRVIAGCASTALAARRITSYRRTSRGPRPASMAGGKRLTQLRRRHEVSRGATDLRWAELLGFHVPAPSSAVLEDACVAPFCRYHTRSTHTGGACAVLRRAPVGRPTEPFRYRSSIEGVPHACGGMAGHRQMDEDPTAEDSHQADAAARVPCRADRSNRRGGLRYEWVWARHTPQ